MTGCCRLMPLLARSMVISACSQDKESLADLLPGVPGENFTETLQELPIAKLLCPQSSRVIVYSDEFVPLKLASLQFVRVPFPFQLPTSFITSRD